MVPGEIQFADDDIEVNKGLDTITLRVTNTGDRPVQVGSHYHFFEVNPALKLDREKVYGYRLDRPAGTSVRFEPGQSHKQKKKQTDAGHKRQLKIIKKTLNIAITPMTPYKAEKVSTAIFTLLISSAVMCVGEMLLRYSTCLDLK